MTLSRDCVRNRGLEGAVHGSPRGQDGSRLLVTGKASCWELEERCGEVESQNNSKIGRRWSWSWSLLPSGRPTCYTAE